MTDVPLFAMARTTDPETSHAAAASVHDLRKSQRAVWWVLDKRGPLTDEQLVQEYALYAVPLGSAPRQSPSGLRTRRAELVRQGLVRDTGERRVMRTGRMARVWRAV